MQRRKSQAASKPGSIIRKQSASSNKDVPTSTAPKKATPPAPRTSHHKINHGDNLTLSDLQFRVRRRLKAFPDMGVKQQLMFAVPMVFLIALSSHLTRLDTLSRHNRRRLATAYHGVEPMQFQLPTKYDVRYYYNEKEPHMPSWFEKINADRTYYDPNTDRYALQRETPYVLYRWCHDGEAPETVLEEVAQSPFRFLSWLGFGAVAEEKPESHSTCHTSGDIVRNMDGLMTALYVARMTNRYLIVEDVDNGNHPTSLKGYLEPNTLQWNITQYQKWHESDDHDSYDFTKTEEDWIPKIHTVADMEDLCHYSSPKYAKLGVEVTAKKWLGETSLAKTACMKKYWKQPIFDQESNRKEWEKRPTFDKRHLYRWGFWRLFRVSDSVLKRADNVREKAGLALSEHSKDTAFEPYYYAANITSHTTNTKPAKKKAAAKAAAEAEAALKCANTMLDASASLIKDMESVRQHIQVHRQLFLESNRSSTQVEGSHHHDHHHNRKLKRSTKHGKAQKESSMAAVVSKKRLGIAMGVRFEAEKIRPKAHWYDNFWSDLVIAIESECLILPAKDPLATGQYNENNRGLLTTAAFLADRISYTNPDTMERCHASAGEETCQNVDLMEKHLTEAWSLADPDPDTDDMAGMDNEWE